MDSVVILVAGLAGVAGILASLAILRRWRPRNESPFGVSTEGEKRCPNCGMGNQWTVSRCVSCGTDLAG